MAKVSVIIPCYNAEKYVDRCMGCLLKQTIGFANLEIIFINDGSTDGTLGKLMWWERQYPEQVILVNFEKNYRQGAARNAGLQYASAEYVAFLDVDDVIAERFYLELYNKITLGDYDWVAGRFVRAFPGEEPDFSIPMNREDIEICCRENEVLFFYDFKKYFGYFGVLPVRLFNKNFILQNQIYFPEGMIYEDNYWAVKCELFAKRVYIIDEPMYCYYINPNSTVSSFDSKAHLQRMEIEEMVVDLFKKSGVFEKYYREIEIHFLQMYYCNTWYAVFMKMVVIPDILPVMRERILEWFPDYRNNPYLDILEPMNRMLLMLLEDENVYTVEELQYIKQAYEEYVLGEKSSKHIDVDKKIKTNIVDKITVIIPCYNVEKYVKECLDSIYFQFISIENLEVICIDDASTDATYDILEEYQKKHSDRFKLLRNEKNQGPGVSRNKALEMATGNYVMFVDADDVIKTDMVQKLYEKILEYDCDYAECGFMMFAGNQKGKSFENKERFYDLNCLDDKKAYIIEQGHKNSCCTKMYKREFIERNKLRFAENIFMEDLYFHQMSMFLASSCYVLKDALYQYRYNENSIMHSNKRDNYFMDTFYVQEHTYQQLNELGKLNNFELEIGYVYYQKAFLEPIREMQRRRIGLEGNEKYELLVKTIISHFPNILDNPYICNDMSDENMRMLCLIKEKM